MTQAKLLLIANKFGMIEIIRCLGGTNPTPAQRILIATIVQLSCFEINCEKNSWMESVPRNSLNHILLLLVIKLNLTVWSVW